MPREVARQSAPSGVKKPKSLGGSEFERLGVWFRIYLGYIYICLYTSSWKTTVDSVVCIVVAVYLVISWFDLVNQSHRLL